MANFFDQFDEEQERPQPAAAPNFFDQFDEEQERPQAVATPNFFDQFDEEQDKPTSDLTPVAREETPDPEDPSKVGVTEVLAPTTPATTPATTPEAQRGYFKQFGTGFASTVETAKYFPDLVGFYRDAQTLGRVEKNKELYDMIDEGKPISPEVLSYYVTQAGTNRAVVDAYRKGTPEQRQKMREALDQQVQEARESAQQRMPALAELETIQQERAPVVEGVTSIRSLADFRDWLGYTSGSVLPQVGLTMAGAALAGVPGALATGFAFNFPFQVENRIDFIMDAVKELSPEEQADAVMEYLDSTADVTMAVAIAQGGLELFGPVGFILRRRLAKQGGAKIAEYATKREAAKAIAKDVLQVQIPQEAATEGLQETLDIAGERILGEQTGDLFSKENINRLIDATAAGAVGGKVGGAINVSAGVGQQYLKEAAERDLQRQIEAQERARKVNENKEEIGTNFGSLVDRYMKSGMTEQEAFIQAGQDLASGSIDITGLTTEADIDATTPEATPEATPDLSTREGYLAETRRLLGDLQRGDILENDIGDTWVVADVVRNKSGEITAVVTEADPAVPESRAGTISIDALGTILIPSPYTDAEGNRRLSAPGKITRAATVADIEANRQETAPFRDETAFDNATTRGVDSGSFPIQSSLGNFVVPASMVAPFATRVQEISGKSLDTIAQEGGIGSTAMLEIVTGMEPGSLTYAGERAASNILQRMGDAYGRDPRSLEVLAPKLREAFTDAKTEQGAIDNATRVLDGQGIQSKPRTAPTSISVRGDGQTITEPTTAVDGTQPSGVAIDSRNATESALREESRPTTLSAKTETDAALKAAKESVMSIADILVEGIAAQVEQLGSVAAAIEAQRAALNQQLASLDITDPSLVQLANQRFNESVEQQAGVDPATQVEDTVSTLTIDDVTADTSSDQLPTNPATGLKPPGKRRGGRKPLNRTPEEQEAAAQRRKDRQKVGRDAIRTADKAMQTIEKPFDPDAFDSVDAAKAEAERLIAERRNALVDAFRILADKNISPDSKAKKTAQKVVDHPSVDQRERTIAENLSKQQTARSDVLDSSTDSTRDPEFTTFDNATQALDHIIKTGNAFERLLAQRLKPFLKGVRVVTVLNPAQDIPNPQVRAAFRGAAGLYVEVDDRRSILRDMQQELGVNLEMLTPYDPRAPEWLKGMDSGNAFVDLADAVASANSRYVAQRSRAGLSTWANTFLDTPTFDPTPPTPRTETQRRATPETTQSPVAKFIKSLGTDYPALTEFLNRSSIRDIFDSRVRQMVALELGDLSATTAETVMQVREGTVAQMQANRRPYPETIPAAVVKQAKEAIDALWTVAASRGLYAEDADGSRTIYLNDMPGLEGTNNMTFLHEAVHGATMAQINAWIRDPSSVSPEAASAIADMQDIMVRAGKAYSILNAVGKTDPIENRLFELGVFGDLKEFVAYGLTQPEMQDFLSRVAGRYQFKNDAGHKGLLTKFVDSIRKMFRMGPQHQDAFQDLIVVTDRLLNAPTMSPGQEAAVAAAKKLNAQDKILEKIRRSRDPLEAVGELTKTSRNGKDAVRFLRAAYDAMSSRAVRAALYVLSSRDIVRWAGNRINNLKDIQIAVDRLAGMKNRLTRELAMQAREWIAYNSRNQEGGKILADLMNASTLVNVDPTLHNSTQDALANDSVLVDLRAELNAAINQPSVSARNPSRIRGEITNRENNIRLIYEGGVSPSGYRMGGWLELGRIGKGQGQKIYQKIKRAYERTFETHQELLLNKIRRSELPGTEEDVDTPKGQLIAEITRSFQEAKQLGVYFPLMRFGNFWLRIGQGKNSEYFMFDSEVKRNEYARRRAEEMARQGETRGYDQLIADQDIAIGNKLDGLRRELVDSSSMLKTIFEALDSSGQVDPNTNRVRLTDVEAIKDQVYQMYLMTLPERDIRRRFTHRQGRTGFTSDTLRTFITSQQTAANQLSRLAYSDEIRTAIGSSYAELAGNPNAPKLASFINELSSRAVSEISPPATGLTDAFGRVGNQAAFLYMLSSIKSAVVQTTQFPIVVLPSLVAKYGLNNTLATVTPYMNIFNRFGLTKYNDDGELITEWGRPSINDSNYVNNHPNPEYRDGLQRAWRTGDMLDIFMSTYASDMNSRSRVPSTDRDNPVRVAVRNVHNFLTGAFHHAERITREVAFMSSYELEYNKLRSENVPHDEAVERATRSAKQFTDDSMFDFTKFNKPTVMTANVVFRLATQFRSFSLQMTSYLVRNFFTMIRVMPTMQQRREAAIKFFGTIGMTALFSGAVGLPLYSVTMGLAEAIRDAMRPDDDDPEADMFYDADDEGNPLGKRNLDLWFRETFIPTHFGKGSALANALGLSDEQALLLQRSVKMGVIPALTDLNIGSSTTLNNLWFQDAPPTDSVRSAYMDMLYAAALGPFGSMVEQGMAGIDDFYDGQWVRGAERMLPAGLRGIAKSYRQATEGERTRDGAVIREEEWFHIGKLMGTTAGFQSTEIAEIQRKNFLARRMLQQIDRERSKILTDLDRAAVMFENQPTDENWARIEAMLERAADFNYRNGFGSLAITQETIQRSLKERAKRRGTAIEGLSVPKSKMPLVAPLLERTQR